jgi:uncharacterized SAM-binding protein YcdF (DUF218 family)
VSTPRRKKFIVFRCPASCYKPTMKFKLRTERTRKRLTWQGRLLVFVISLGLFSFLFFNLYSFLAPDHAPKTGIMVVEGWIHDEALAEAVHLFEAGNYSMIACTGIPIETGSYLQEFGSYSEMTAARLRELGIPKSAILVCTADDFTKDRTYQSAVALRDALANAGISEKKLHLVTTGPHGRRSRMLFQKALGKDYKIGITCLPDNTYMPSKWFACSEGVRSVVGEAIAYIYAKLFFHP